VASCAAELESVKERFIAKTGIQKSALDEDLNNCLRSQGSMNSCSYFVAFAVREEMEQALQQALKGAPDQCAQRQRQLHSKWLNTVAQRCVKRADELIGYQGTARAGVITACEAEEFQKRARTLPNEVLCPATQ
jgi:hypothetical protein